MPLLPVTKRDQYLYYLTRDPAFLWKLAAIILALGLALAAGLHFLRLHSPENENSDALNDSSSFPYGRDFSDRTNPDDESFYFYIEVLCQAYLSATPEQLNSLGGAISVPLRDSPVSEDRAQVVRALLASLNETDAADEPRLHDSLQELMQESPPVRFAYFAAGTIHRSYYDFEKAGEYFAAEAESYPEVSATSADSAATAFIEAGADEKLRQLLDNPQINGQLRPITRRDIAVYQEDWLKILLNIFPAQYQDPPLGLILFALFSGAVWFILVLRLCQIPFKPSHVLLCLAAVALGFASIAVTLVIDVWQEVTWGLTPGSDSITDTLLYFVAGVGLREEFSKLLLFSPLLIVLLGPARNNERLALATACCVGLGFAIEENVGYFERSAGIAGIGRFVTANFLHLALTGLAGLSLVRAFKNPSTGVSDFLITFLVVVLAHGFYNTLLTIQIYPAVENSIAADDGSFLSFIIFILIAYRFFEVAYQTRSAETRGVISQTSIFVSGFCLITVITLLALTWSHGVGPALQLSFSSALSVAILMVMFIQQFRET